MGGNNRYWQLRWSDDIPTEEEYSVKQWCMVYSDNIYQDITFEDGTEWEITTRNKDADIEKIKDYIAGGHEFRSEMSRAARLLDDDKRWLSEIPRPFLIYGN